VQIALGLAKETTRPEIAEACLEMEERRIPPIIVNAKDAPVKQNVKTDKDVDLYELPIMRHPKWTAART